MLDHYFITGFIGSLAALVLIYFVFRHAAIFVKPYETALVMKFGRCNEEIKSPGLHFRPSLWMPGIHAMTVSRQLDYELMQDLHVNDRDGTTLRVDLWLETRVVDARKSVFAVESWHEALRHLVLHTLMAKMGNTRLEALLVERTTIAEEILEEVRSEAATWGVSVEGLCIQDVRLLPEISKQFFDRVSARIELKKSRIEEEGRIRIQTMQAETDRKIAELQAQARTMHPMAVGRAYKQLSSTREVLDGFQELNQLSLLQPGKVVSFVGFKGEDIRPIDAMLIPETLEGKSVSQGSRMN